MADKCRDKEWREAEYIEREAAFNAVLKLIPKVDDDGYCWVIRGDAATAIDSIPAADVRPVVLCRDCKWCHAGYCEKYDDLIPWGVATGRPWEDWFCADGRKADV